MSTEDLEDYESEVELQLYREYRDVCPMFRYWVETERRSYLANDVDVAVRAEGNRTWFEVTLRDVWVSDMFRTNRFLPSVRVLAFKDVVVEELPREDDDAADPGATADAGASDDAGASADAGASDGAAGTSGPEARS